MSNQPCVFCNKIHDYDREHALQIMRKTSDTLRELLDSVTPDMLAKKPEKGWSPRQILIHLIDCEYAYGFRFRYIMAEDNPVIMPYDQEAWVNTFTYGNQDATQLVRAFTPIRRVNIELLQTVDPKLFDKPAKHPEYGTITVAQIIPHLAYHDLNHLQQIRDRIPAA